MLTGRRPGPLAWLFGSAALALLGWQMLTYTIVIYARAATGSDAATGTLFLCLMAPTLLLTLYAGVLADRSSKHRLLRNAQIALVAGVSALALAVAWFGESAGGLASMPWLPALMVLIGVVSSFTGPTRMALVPSLAGPGQVEKATVYIALVNYVCIAVGPAVAGALKSVLAWPWLFAAAAACYAASTALLAMAPADTPASAGGASRSVLGEARDGVLDLFRNAALGQVTLFTVLVSLFVLGPLQVLAPEYLKQNFGLSESGRGLFVGSFGVGILVGGGAGAALLGLPHRGLLVAASALVAAGAFLAFALAQGPHAAGAALVACGAGVGATMALASATMQLLTRPEFRGRTMSILALVILGVPALAGQLAALGAEASSLRAALSCAGAGGVAGVALLALLARSLRAHRPAAHHPAPPAEQTTPTPGGQGYAG